MRAITNPPLEKSVDVQTPAFQSWVREQPLPYSDTPEDSDDDDDEVASLRGFRKYVVL